MDFYQVMGIARDADAAAVKKAYRRLVKECHPDTHPGDRQAERRFKQVAEAYAVLSDVEKRKKYDWGLAAVGKGRERKATQGKPGGGQKEKNPLDVSSLFEKYMGFR